MPHNVPPAASTAPDGEAALVRAVGGVTLTAAIINIIVGAGIFMLPALLLSRMGAAAPVAFLAGALAIVPIALCFAAIGSRVQVTGGPYSYLTATFGPFAGFIAGALMWISNLTSSAGVAAALSVQVASLVPALAPPLPASAQSPGRRSSPRAAPGLKGCCAPISGICRCARVLSTPYCRWTCWSIFPRVRKRAR